MIKDLKQIRTRELKVGDYLINLGMVLEIEQNADDYSVVVGVHEKQVFKFFPGAELLIIENAIVDGPMEYLLSPGLRDTLKSMFKTKRIDIKSKTSLNGNER
ncbi:hypothetical protein J7E50_05380 [Pedobacter sp. ISL-68]|uniref:hypothetical protein n=1 Tax=unclassified Pedobacter TaxID=2628915 RepID=UPI001BE9C5FF|nr:MULTISPECIES: hypothetical protein [unclassified Pedobacter]MBT2563747.1 hypothetical protein [Pedobacter sp. ISL-64]MBT2589639.1 hypothetical protein [Pedobacter sp. ISL-68]